ncbi:Na-translocating system protein MpsC family protein [Baekduia sp. Peel2402]|uniref:Na-translocating system protein MpsC family protein n=1 Tax=Baekduia sp. Peel2402 TaxID=3458296 RepID=UPI00403E3C05
MVRLYKSLFGRGPKRARTDFAGPDTIIVTLEESLTPAEQTMADLGEHQRLRDIRMLFQYAREADFREVIESNTGRRVRAFVSRMDTKKDVSCEVFYLEREG